jgi:uncharacterized protein YbaR (Trm112 family)
VAATVEGGTVSLDPRLLELLACPGDHHAPLTYDEGAATLACTGCGRVFPIVDGIPDLLLDDAVTPRDAP